MGALCEKRWKLSRAGQTRALVCGVSGQDGAHLAQLLLSKGYEVWGTSRDAQVTAFNNLAWLGLKDRVTLVSMVPNDFRSVLTTLKRSDPDEVYFLSGQSSVGLSFEQPVETFESVTMSWAAYHYSAICYMQMMHCGYY
jgi:GDPmannose 4,6-dehydratase